MKSTVSLASLSRMGRLTCKALLCQSGGRGCYQRTLPSPPLSPSGRCTHRRSEVTQQSVLCLVYLTFHRVHKSLWATEMAGCHVVLWLSCISLCVYELHF